MEAAVADGDFAGGVRQADDMLRLRGELGQINPCLIPVTPQWANKGNGALESYRQTYKELAARVNGERGSLVAMTPRRWQFRKDPEQIGTFYQWYAPNAKGGWASLDSTLYWEAQGLHDARGYGRAGQTWYRSAVEVPANAADKPVRLAIGGIFGDELWTWINGRLVDHRSRLNSRNPFDLNVSSYIQPGQTNHIAFLIENQAADRNRDGLYRRVFLWSPKETE
jgi:hypothetical protein